MILNYNLSKMFLFTLGLIIFCVFIPYISISGFVVLGVYNFYLYKNKKLSFFDIIFSISLIMNMWFIEKSFSVKYQYDYYNFYMHMAYVIENNFFIFSPKSYINVVYFQPPLWGVISGLVTKVVMWLGENRENAFNFVRFINLFAISGACIIFFRILNRFNINKKISILMFTLFCFYPINTILSNLVNNDAFVYFLMLCMVYMASLWYDNSSYKNALGLGGLLFVAGMTKFSGLMLVPALGGLCLCKIFGTKIEQRCSVFYQSLIIGMFSIFGFAWGLFLLYFNLPLVPPLQNADYQSMVNFSLFDRLLDFSGLSVLFVDIHNGVLEPNVLLSLLKTSLFGEWSWGNPFSGYVLMWVGLFLSIAFILSFFSLFKYKLGNDFSFNLFMIVAVFSVLISWISFWIEFPYFCSTEYRYVAILLPLSLLWFANCLSQKNLPKWFYYTLASFVIVFVFAKFMLYLNTI